MVRSQGSKPQGPLSQTELQGLNQEKRDLEDALKQTEEFGTGTAGSQIDKNALKKQIAGLTSVIDAGTPRELIDAERAALVKEEKEIENQLKVGMPTKYEMRRPSENPGAVRKHLTWNGMNTQKIERYRIIQRLLRPFDPKSIETLRKEK